MDSATKAKTLVKERVNRPFPVDFVGFRDCSEELKRSRPMSLEPALATLKRQLTVAACLE